MNKKFVDDTLTNHIKITINDLFLSLNSNDKNILISIVVDIINKIAFHFNFDYNDKPKYMKQFTQNNNRDIIAIIKLILPYIDEKNNLELYHTLGSFNDLYIAKEDGKFKFTNIQYSRFFVNTNIGFGKLERNEEYITDVDVLNNVAVNNKYYNTYIVDDDIEYEQFDISHFENNKLILMETISKIGGKLYVNWVNIRPLGITTNIYELGLYKLASKYFDANPAHFNISKDVGIIDMIYTVLVNEFYDKIKNVKWYIFEANINDKIHTYLEILNDLFPLDNIFNELEWDELDQNVKYKYTEKWNELVDAINLSGSYGQYSVDIINELFRTIFLFVMFSR